MDMDAIPIIEITIRQLTHQIQSHMGVFNSELGKSIEKEINRQFPKLLKDTDVSVSKELRSAHSAAVSRIIRDYFSSPNGRGYVRLQSKIEKFLNKELDRRLEALDDDNTSMN